MNDLPKNGQYTRTMLGPVHVEDETAGNMQFEVESPGISPKFFLKHIRKPTQDLEKHPDGFVLLTKQMVRLSVAGDPLQVSEQKVTAKHARMFPKAYQRFMAGQQMVHDGTPLEVWPQMLTHEGLLELLHINHVYTVEALAEVNDSNLKNLGGLGTQLRAQARAYVEAKKTNAPIDAMQAKNAELEKMLIEAKAQAEQANKEAGEQRDATAVLRDQMAQMNEMMAQMRQQMSATRQGDEPDAAPEIDDEGEDDDDEVVMAPKGQAVAGGTARGKTKGAAASA